jgi:hypothetical protein
MRPFQLFEQRATVYIRIGLIVEHQHLCAANKERVKDAVNRRAI